MMNYRGVINVDFTGSDGNQRTRLNLALREAGWHHVETSAFVRETMNINDLWQGIALVAKKAGEVGQVSALTFHIQGSQDFNSNVQLTTTLSPKNALDEIKSMPYPGDRDELS